MSDAPLADALSWAQAAHDAPEREALRWGDHVWSFSALHELLGGAMAQLAARGVRPGVRAAVQAPNGLDALLTSIAVLELGATLVPVHPRLTPAETAPLLRDAGAELVLATAPHDSPRPLVDGPPSPEALVLFTSGTSGRPRGAVLSRRALIAAAAASAQNLGTLPDERWLLCLPLCHIGGLSIVTRSLLARGCVVLAPNAQPDTLLALLARHRPTLLSVVPTTLHALLAADHDNRLARLRAVLVGGAAAPATLLDECARRGVLALTTYGLTEACSQVTTQALRDPHRREPGSGRPLAGVQVELREDDGRAVAPGQVGKIWIDGPALMDGYLHEPPRRGWFDTGDLGSWDEAGRLHVHARRTDLIVTGGENVYPTEVEQALLGLPGVAGAMVFGVPDEVWGQLVAVAIQPAGALDEVALGAAIPRLLAAHKRPRLYCLTDALPLGGTGKPLRREALARFGARLRPWPAG